MYVKHVPFNVVECKYQKLAWKKVGVTLPSEKMFRETLLHEISDEVIAKNHQELMAEIKVRRGCLIASAVIYQSRLNCN